MIDYTNEWLALREEFLPEPPSGNAVIDQRAASAAGCASAATIPPARCKMALG
jgi:hypothetical protein